MRGAEPVKTERHDVGARQHHTNTGIRPVHTYREHAHGLFVARDFVAHPRIRHWQAHLLPALGAVVCRYDFHGLREHDYYIDIATVTRVDDLWTVRDHYLDLLVHEGMAAEIVDTGELLAAHDAGFIGTAELHHAVTTAHQVLSGLARARYELGGWLAGQGIELDWLSVPEYLTA
ncbi:DUF402 domain-containing protein [Deinococcus metallilatus]|uniref:DUF402 domain-containing protein n=1 Tax=Deinococcus metallilatus TaxID=1211322 RepID=A0AAJ5F517_9DEIO|nr:DUF402 domain-containing protein [Deinococcus metallilatus]MBB5294052.1 hypothetical protein [Deinococcus metallilatus]QBY08840.1 DUF402 domain-containing protein [Deinococcus metallilatus]RXJ09984.1 DUF402 domain-containing protein [Deinococcus metallilatus]TLK28079.1 DUF402 domain-containing protein [Deinococcus metallilatus]GMA16613.1 hypothetical protein GCM10025871_29440 [Deinococcus metallilatus]